ncbi:hypothetical protein VHUM_01183 [Vanrija humicola]|uniref:AMP-dependent synthetase/ligase domain-containing protein n=1 Tax=Vanrija humicola TaxID=5417 RepID=A0A7D8V245_VANHU|nr:hypothetical protein VHUM_01183 [Vanrija humicola]
MKTWKHTPPTFRDFIGKSFARWAAEGRELVSEPVPEPAAYYARQKVSYAEVYARGLVLAAWLRQQGVRVGTRVAIGGGNSSEWISAFVAVNLVGGCSILLNSSLQPDVQAHCLALTKPAVILAEPKYAEVIAPLAGELAAKGVGKIYSWGPVFHLPRPVQDNVTDITSVNPLPEVVAAVERGDGLEGYGPESDGIIYFTSGTTSMPKGVMLTQHQCLVHVLAGSIPGARARLRAGEPLESALAVAEPPEVQPVMLLPVPLFHVTGSLGWLVRAWVVGGRLVFVRRWNVEDAARLMVEEKVAFFGGVPAVAVAVIQSNLLPKDHIIEGITYGGAPPPQRLAADIANRWAGASAQHAYGMTETAGLHTGVAGQDYIDRPEAVGLAVPIAEIRVVNPVTKQPLPPGEMGLLECRGSNIMKEYIDNPKATAEAINADGWLNTGDMASIDAEGYLYIRDRAKDVIIRGGENIASAEVENAVYLDGRVAEAAAVPVPCERMGERVAVAVSLAPGASATAEEIQAAVRPRLRHVAQPAIVVIWPEPLPRNANRKILKADIKKIVHGHWDAQGRQETRAKL